MSLEGVGNAPLKLQLANRKCYPDMTLILLARKIAMNTICYLQNDVTQLLISPNAFKHSNRTNTKLN